MLVSDTKNKVLEWNCDEPDVRRRLTEPTSTELKAEIGDANLILIDEAQRIKNIGITLKLLIDNYPEKQVIATGSSAIEMSNSINEPLTGRKYEYVMYPFSCEELFNEFGEQEERRMLERRLIYGSYPEVVNNSGEERETLTELVGSYLYKDIFSFQDVRKPEIIEQLLQALALQIGSEVSYNELGRLLGLNTATVQRYIDLLEKSYVVFHPRSFKNYIIAERLKHNAYNSFYGKSYFWRTQQQQEIDYIEDIDGVLHTYEFKWNNSKHPRLTDTFAKNYPNHTFTVVSPENYQSFVKGEI